MTDDLDDLSPEDDVRIAQVMRGMARYARWKGYRYVREMGDMPARVGPKLALLGAAEDASRLNPRLLAEIEADLATYQQGEATP
jgi:hypothetical protein